MDLILTALRNTVAVFVPAAVLIWFFKLRKRGTGKRDVYFLVFLFYLLFLLSITVVRYGPQPGGGTLNLVPLKDLIQMAGRGDITRFLYLALGNVAWFVPFGFLVPRMKKVSLLQTALLAFLLSLSIEILQFAFANGVTETDDLILNTLGAVLGFGIHRLTGKEYNR